MSYISSFHFLSGILHHSDVVVSDALCSSFPWGFLHWGPQPSSLSSSSFTSPLCCCPWHVRCIKLLWFTGRKEQRCVGSSYTTCLDWEQMCNESLRTTCCNALTEVSSVGCQGHDMWPPTYSIRWEVGKSPTFSFWTLTSKILPTWRIIPIVWVPSVVYCCVWISWMILL